MFTWDLSSCPFDHLFCQPRQRQSSFGGTLYLSVLISGNIFMLCASLSVSFSCCWAERISLNISGSLDKCLLAGIGLVWVFACLCSAVKNVLWVYHRADSAQLSPQCCVSVIFFLLLWADTCGSLAHKRTHHRLISRKVEVASVRTGRLSGSVANWAPAEAAAAAQLSSVPGHFGDKPRPSSLLLPYDIIFYILSLLFLHLLLLHGSSPSGCLRQSWGSQSRSQFQLVPLRYDFFFFYLPRSPHQQYSGYLFMYLFGFFCLVVCLVLFSSTEQRGALCLAEMCWLVLLWCDSLQLLTTSH